MNTGRNPFQTQTATLIDQEAAREAAGKRRDLDLTRKQAEALIEQLDEEGREIAVDIVRGLTQLVDRANRDLEEVREELAELRAGTKTSRGRDRASASGTITRPGVAEHKHNYSPEGDQCIKFAGGIRCTAVRQRNRKAKETNG